LPRLEPTNRARCFIEDGLHVGGGTGLEPRDRQHHPAAEAQPDRAIRIHVGDRGACAGHRFLALAAVHGDPCADRTIECAIHLARERPVRRGLRRSTSAVSGSPACTR
jgi:hypothetical protein